MNNDDIKVLSDVSKYDERTREALATALEVAYAAQKRGVLPNEAITSQAPMKISPTITANDVNNDLNALRRRITDISRRIPLELMQEVYDLRLLENDFEIIRLKIIGLFVNGESAPTGEPAAGNSRSGIIHPKIKREDLDRLSVKYLNKAEYYSYFVHLWRDFLASLPSPLIVQSFLDDLTKMGYTKI